MRRLWIESEFLVEWYCLKCWQEGTVRYQGDTPPLGWPDPNKIAGVAKHHAALLAGIVDHDPCDGEFGLLKPHTVKKRVRKIPSPLLPDTDDPIIINKRGTR